MKKILLFILSVTVFGCANPLGGTGTTIPANYHPGLSALLFGAGTDGYLNISSSLNLNSTPSPGRSYADGIAYRVTNLVSATTVDVGQTPNGFAAGDAALLINLQGASGDSASVGLYEFVWIFSVQGTQLTFVSAAVNSYGGQVFSNQKIILQRVPQYSNVVLTSGAALTAGAWDGLTTAPAGTAGYNTGIIAFYAKGSVIVNSGSKIDGTSLGYRGGITKISGPEGLTGFVTTGGGGGGGGSGGHVGPGGAGADGAGTGVTNPSGTVAAGGTGLTGGGGGGAGGGWGSNFGGAATNGGGAGAGQSGNIGGPGFIATAAGSGGGGAAANRDSAGGGGGGAALSAVNNASAATLGILILGGGASSGAGGGGGGGQGDFQTPTGGGGGSKIGSGGARGLDTCSNLSTNGADGFSGASGGGIIIIVTPTLTSYGAILAPGGAGGAGGAGGNAGITSCSTAGSGGGGGGGAGASGGSVLFTGGSLSFGSVSAVGGAAGSGGLGGSVGFAGGAGLSGYSGSAGVVRVYYSSTYSGTSTPAAAAIPN